uniref:Mucin-like domain-containing protein n=1 Tax=Oncorhynchus mykiss TaxID=8022 RepID=A0A8K9V351_ONCMY
MNRAGRPLFMKTYGKQNRKLEAWISPDNRKQVFASTSSSDLSIVEPSSPKPPAKRVRKRSTADIRRELRPAKTKALSWTADGRRELRLAKTKALSCLREQDSDEENIFIVHPPPQQQSNRKPFVRRAGRKARRIVSSSESDGETTTTRQPNPKRSQHTTARARTHTHPSPVLAPGKFVTHRRGATTTTAKHKAPKRKLSVLLAQLSLNSSDDFVQGGREEGGVVQRSFPRRAKQGRRRALANADSSLADLGNSGATNSKGFLRDISLNVSPERPCHRKPLFSSTPSSRSLPPPPSFLRPPISPSASDIISLSTTQEELDVPEDPLSLTELRQLSSLGQAVGQPEVGNREEPTPRGSTSLRSNGSRNGGSAIQDGVGEQPSPELFSAVACEQTDPGRAGEETEDGSHFVSVTVGQDWLAEVVKERCLTRCCAVRLERVYKLHGDTTCSPCVDQTRSHDNGRSVDHVRSATRGQSIDHSVIRDPSRDHTGSVTEGQSVDRAVNDSGQSLGRIVSVSRTSEEPVRVEQRLTTHCEVQLGRLTVTRPHRETSLTVTRPHRETSLTETRPHRETSLTVTQPHRETSLTVTQPHRETSLTETRPHRETSLTVTRPHRETSLTVTQPHRETSLTVTQPHRETSLTETRPHRETSLTETRPHRETSLTVTQPHRETTPPGRSNGSRNGGSAIQDGVGEQPSPELFSAVACEQTDPGRAGEETEDDSHFVSATVGQDWLVVKERCLTRCCAVRLERVYKLHGDTTCSPCVDQTRSHDNGRSVDHVRSATRGQSIDHSVIRDPSRDHTGSVTEGQSVDRAVNDSGQSLGRIVSVSRTSEEPVRVKQRLTTHCEVQLGRLTVTRPHRETSLTETRPHRETSLTVTRPHRETSLTVTQPHRETSLTETRPHRETSLTETRPHTSLTETRPHRETSLTETRPHRETSLTETRPHRETSLTETRPHRETSLTVTRPHRETSLTETRPHTSLTETRPHRETSLTVTQPHRETSLTVTQPHRETSLTETRPHRETSLTETRPHRETSLTETRPHRETSLTVTRPHRETSLLPSDHNPRSDSSTAGDHACSEHVPRDSLVPKEHVPRDSLVPKEHVPRDSLVPKEHVPKDSLVPKEHVPRDSLVPKEHVPKENPHRRKVGGAPIERRRRSVSRERPATSRKVCVSGVSVSRWGRRDGAPNSRAAPPPGRAGDCSITELLSAQHTHGVPILSDSIIL